MKITKWNEALRRGIAGMLAAVMLFGMLPNLPNTHVHAQEAVEASAEAAPELEPLYQTIPVTPGQLLPDPVEIVENEIYGYVVDYELKKGHVLSISNTDYVFSVRKLINGNYSTMLKQATVDSFTATEDMTVGMLIRKPDKSALTAEELAGVVIVDTLFGMENVSGTVHRFTVEAETIDGGTATTRAAIFLPPSYSEDGVPTRLIVMTNGYHGHLNDTHWNANKPDDVALMKHYLEAKYAVLVVDNTAKQTSDTPDAGSPQQVSGYFKSYEYVQDHFHVEEMFSLHARSQGNLVALRMMREHPELVKCALMTGSQLSFKQVWDMVDTAFVAKRFGFDDPTGATYEADKVIGYDPLVDSDGIEYDLPPTFWMMAQSDASTITLSGIEKIKAHGNDVTTKVYTGTDHSGVCRLNIAECWNDALAYLEAHQTSAAEHRYYAWETVRASTCDQAGEMRRYCADCEHFETLKLEAMGEHVRAKGMDYCAFCGKIWLTKLYEEIPVEINKLQIDGSVLEDAFYGHVKDYTLLQGHTLSISSTEHVFSVRQLLNGDYSTQLKVPATADSYTANADMTVGVWIRRPDSSELEEGELAGIRMIDSIYGMIGVDGYVHRFSVEAETIDGGTATTRAAIFLPPSYSEDGLPMSWIIMTNGLHGHLNDAVWNANTDDDVAVMKHYMEAGYAILVVDNTARRTSSTTDLGNPQLISSYWKAYEYVQAHFNLEELFSLHSRSQGTFAAMRIMREHPELVKCALMCGAVTSLKSRFSQNPAFIAGRFGFDDATGATYEADKVVGYDPYTDVNGVEYDLPPTFWMMAEADANTVNLTTINKIETHGNDVTTAIYTDTDHSGVCRLNTEGCWADALAYLEAHQTSDAEHRYCAWVVTREVTCTEAGEMRRKCADCDRYETMELEALSGHVSAEKEEICIHCGQVLLDPLYQEISVVKGTFSDSTGAWQDSNVYGSIVGYELKKGHTLTISDTNYVFVVRQLIGGNYNTMIQTATSAGFTATEDMTVAIRVRKPDKSAVTAEELASVVLYDTQYGMQGVEGYAQRFYVDAETIEGGTAATRCNIFLPASYSEDGEATKLIVMTNGHSAYLKDNVWNGNTADNVGIIRNYLDAGYAVWVVNNTADSTSRTTDIGCPQLVSSYLEAYAYIQEHFNVEKKFSIHSRSFGTFSAVRIMLEVPELVNCAVMTGPRVSIKLAWTANKAFVAKRFGFADTTGATYEADKMVGHDPYTDINGESYSLPPTFWMMCQGDATAEPLVYIDKLIAHGNDVTSATYTGTDHTGICTLNQDHMFADALAFLERNNAPALEIQYDDYLDMSGKTVEIIDAGTPTSYKVGYGVAEGTLDDAVVTLEGDTLITAGIGTAYVRIDGVLYKITVEAAPISLLLLIGQSNMEGMVGNANQSIACQNGQVYATYAKANGLTGDAGLTVDNAGDYVPSALTGAYSTVNVNGTDNKLSGYPVNSLTEAGAGKYGMDSAIAYEWTRQTGEKVWVVNAAHGASSISSWQKGQSNFEEACALFSACQDVLMQEIAAGHYTFSHMGYYWCQGCADETKSAQWYVNQYLAMHENLKTELAFDADLDLSTEDTTFEFGGIVLVMAGHETATGYRKGTYSDSADSFFASFKELEMRGPRVAQIWMANNPDLKDIHLVCTLAQDWVTMPDGTDGVEAYFTAHYENGAVDYPTQVKQSASWYAPKTPAAVKNSIHYYQVGYNEVGREAARNTLYILGLLEKPKIETTVSFLDWTGYQSVDTMKTSSVGSSETLVVPMVYPCYESKSVTYSVTDGLQYLYYDLLDTGVDGGTLTASVGDHSVTVTGREYYAYRFELVNGEMVSVVDDIFRENVLTRNSPSTKTYGLTDTVVLKHNKPWTVEFNSVDAARFMALASTKGATDGMFYFFKSKSGSGVLSIGEYKDGLYQNYGLKQQQIGIDWTEPHIYRFQNVINADGTNIIHIYIDNEWVGTATNLIINDSIQSTENMYLSGKDLTFSSIGCGGFALDSDQMTYLEVWENGKPNHIPGDINGDGNVDNKDLTRLFKYLSGYDVQVNEAALDVNGDGSVNNKDQTRLFRYLSGYPVEIY